jgi:predicted nucleic acid-binding Zn ribbon protein
MNEIVIQHSHCSICGKAIPFSEMFCSEECKVKYASMMKKRKIVIYTMYALIGVIITLYILTSN